MGANFTDKNCESCELLMVGVGYNRKWCDVCNANQTARQVKHRYGLHPRDFYRMMDEQDGVCAICFSECVRGKLSVDHDHKTGKIRGLLCNDCNTTLGKFKDDPDRFRQAASYLESNLA